MGAMIIEVIINLIMGFVKLSELNSNFVCTVQHNNIEPRPPSQAMAMTDLQIFRSELISLFTFILYLEPTWSQFHSTSVHTQRYLCEIFNSLSFCLLSYVIFRGSTDYST